MGLRILVVDDNQAVLGVICRILETNGLSVGTAGTGADGLELLRTHEFDMVLSDFSMPGMTGDEFLRQVTAECPTVPTVLLTGSTNLPRRVSAGAILRKPVCARELLDCIRELTVDGCQRGQEGLKPT